MTKHRRRLTPVDDWYRTKLYSHFDEPLSYKRASNYVKNQKNIISHQFLPFLAFVKEERKYRTERVDVIDANGNVRREKRRKAVESKKRPLRKTPHVDGYVYAYYTKLLSVPYEALLDSLGLGAHVIAYRKGQGSNIELAKKAFREVSARGNCSVAAFDISSFFDSIDHANLRRQWCRLLKLDSLPSDHYAVFRAMTRYCWVDLDECCKRLGINPKLIVPGGRLCSANVFREKIREQKPTLIRVNKANYGIPQGSPISALLSNISMLPFDEAAASACAKHGWFYLRYSDDILVIGKPGEGPNINAFVSKELQKLGAHLFVNDKKTEIFEFELQAGVQTIRPIGVGLSFKPLQYLGFSFDGQKIRIKSATLSRFWRKLVRSTHAAKIRAKKRQANGRGGAVLKHRVYEQVTHLGTNNFYSYVRRARKKLDDESIRKQLARHFDRVELELK